MNRKLSILTITVLLVVKVSSEATHFCPNPRFEGINRQSFPGVCGMQLLVNLGEVCRSVALQRRQLVTAESVRGKVAGVKFPKFRTAMNFDQDNFINLHLLADPKRVKSFLGSSSSSSSSSNSSPFQRTRRNVSSNRWWNPQNIVCECCFHHCSHQEMIAWC